MTLINVMLFLTDYSLNLGSVNNNENITAAGGRSTEYLDLAKKGGGHKGNSVRVKVTTLLLMDFICLVFINLTVGFSQNLGKRNGSRWEPFLNYRSHEFVTYSIFLLLVKVSRPEMAISLENNNRKTIFRPSSVCLGI